MAIVIHTQIQHMPVRPYLHFVCRRSHHCNQNTNKSDKLIINIANNEWNQYLKYLTFIRVGIQKREYFEISSKEHISFDMTKIVKPWMRCLISRTIKILCFKIIQVYFRQLQFIWESRFGQTSAYIVSKMFFVYCI